MPHARGRLVEQHQLGIESQRRRELERAFAAIGQFDGCDAGIAGETYGLEQLFGTWVEFLEARWPSARSRTKSRVCAAAQCGRSRAR